MFEIGFIRTEILKNLLILKKNVKKYLTNVEF